MSDSRLEKSLGSSAGASVADAFCSSRAALPPFLRRHGEVVKNLVDREAALDGLIRLSRYTEGSFLERRFHDVALVWCQIHIVDWATKFLTDSDIALE